MLKKTGCRPLAVWTMLLLACTAPFCCGFFYGNYGFLCGLLLIAAVRIAPAHPVLAGLCLMFAGTKPQLAALFYLALLLEGHWKPVLVGGLGTLGAWGIAAAACHTSPLTSWVPIVSWWGLCFLCAAPDKTAGRFRALL